MSGAACGVISTLHREPRTLHRKAVDVHCDFLIIGSGIAALRAAIELADAGDILMLTKAESAEGSTGYAQGGIAAAVGPDDSPAQHAADTLAAGDGLCDEKAVRVLVEEGPRYVRELISWGAEFDRDPDGRLALAREGAHSVRRVLHARDATGREICRALWERIAGRGTIRVAEHSLATDLLTERDCCVGVRFLDDRGEVRSAHAGAVLVATGGAGQVYRETTNPPVASGDGIAMAYRVGARVTDLEFVQFHPTALVTSSGARFLLSEALRGEGARLVNTAGEAFMTRYDPAGDLAPRDRVARSIVREVEATGHPVALTLAHLPADFVHRRFPYLSEMCRRAGFDLARDRLPVGPAAHYIMGGVVSDLEGRTTRPALFAAGEVACTGVHGANRLASNSLLEGLVFGARAGSAMRRWHTGQASWAADVSWTVEEGYPSTGSTGSRGSPDAAPPEPAEPRAPSEPTAPGSGIDISESDIRALMWRDVGLFRDKVGLERAVAVFERGWQSPGGRGGARDARLTSLVTVGRLIARAALRREESRGAHFRSDFPTRNDIDWNRHVAETRSEDAR